MNEEIEKLFKRIEKYCEPAKRGQILKVLQKAYNLGFQDCSAFCSGEYEESFLREHNEENNL